MAPPPSIVQTCIATPAVFQKHGEDPILPHLVSNGQAECLLHRFKTAMTPHFPFVVVSQYTTVQSLQQEKPLLMLSILAAAAYDDVTLQRRLGDQVKQSITHRTFYVEAMSLEILQALLVHLAW